YGKFNYLLLLAVLPASFSSIFSSSAMSYVLPSAECDLNLTMFDKGLLNSMTFAGGIAWLIIPQKWTITTGSGALEINSWRVFLAICSLPEFLACIAIFAFPESPRFLLMKGRREEALEVFKKIYSVNTGKDPDTYPVKDIEDEYSVESASDNIKDKLRSCWQQIKPLFLSPNIFKLIAIGMIQLGATIGSNSIRLWMPQLFTMMEQFKNDYLKHEYSSSQPRFCYMLGQQQGTSHNSSTSFTNETLNVAHACVPAELNSKVFINSIVIATTGVVGYTLAGTLITVIGKKKLITTCFIVAAACCASLYWAEHTNSILGLCSVFVAMSSIGGACVVNIIVDNFPTCLRTMAVSLTMMVGRIGAVLGNLLFPVLFDLTCLGPFIMIGSASL
ncbi:unnamed protein product, partial [Heterotrigona itama]